MKFIGRTRELQQIEREISTDGLRTVLIYGRRRAGKSELVKQALKAAHCRSIYYECRQVKEASSVSDICEMISEVFNLPKLGYISMDELLEYVFKTAVDDELIFVLDEYPYLRENVKGMDSILQSKIDKYKDTSNLTMIILGSYVDVMKSLLENSNPLFGRMNHRCFIRIKSL